MSRLAASLRDHILLLAVPLCCGCWVPEEFEATLDVRRNGTFTFKYDGLLTDAFSRAAAVEGKLKQSQEPALLLQVSDEAAKDSRFKSIEYVGRQHFRVSYVDTGTLDRPLVFLSKEHRFFSIVQKQDG